MAMKTVSRDSILLDGTRDFFLSSPGGGGGGDSVVWKGQLKRESTV